MGSDGRGLWAVVKVTWVGEEKTREAKGERGRVGGGTSYQRETLTGGAWARAPALARRDQRAGGAMTMRVCVVPGTMSGGEESVRATAAADRGASGLARGGSLRRVHCGCEAETSASSWATAEKAEESSIKRSTRVRVLRTDRARSVSTRRSSLVSMVSASRTNDCHSCSGARSEGNTSPRR